MGDKPTAVQAELPGMDVLEHWKLRNFSPSFDHKAAMEYRTATKSEFKRQADMILDSILESVSKK